MSVDGNDVGAVSDAAERAIGRMRSGGGPAFIECATYRWRGHVGHREDEDVGVKRKDDLALWKRRDPIARLSTSLVTSGVISADHVDRLSEQLATEVAAAWAEAMADPFPDPSCLVGRTLSHSPAFQ